MAGEHAQRLRALGGQIGQVGGDQFPSHVGGIGTAAHMHALGNAVVRQNQRFGADREDGRIVAQAPRAGSRGDRTEKVDIGEFGTHASPPGPTDPAKGRR